ncbi:AbrB family transcriptional regulator [Mesobaculum littorinae]|uniref:AbrB family transcriptional regulator n=1 Tax=Mesobaculum littorinae TaxID=2486419 RepID=A0A438AJ22_9RHOB|nr:AbrB family transcriptional regulator [Mesobaculum littorinae]RVV98669.1 AbrB family transcriptional regulator [Mesobaculum littorinae]
MTRTLFSPNVVRALITLAFIAAGGAGGLVAAALALPMPYMLGSLAVTSTLIGLLQNRLPGDYVFPQRIRAIFIAVVGTLIGAQVDPSFVSQIPEMAISLFAVTFFVLIAHATNYLIFRRMGGYDKPTAFFCGSPGGLIESITLGEQAGANVQLLTLQHFLRIILVVTILPLALSIWHGEALGSAAGVQLSGHPVGLGSLPLLIAVAVAGLVLGIKLRLPAGQLLGPLVFAALASGSGLLTVEGPGWTIGVAQIVIGVSLGARFAGVTRQLLFRGLRLSAVSAVSMLLIGAAFSEGLHLVTGNGIEALLISFAPGGVSEMGLIALSLAVNPAFVTFHHLYRIAVTVIEISIASRWFRPRQG